jgi:monoamine oxidase
VLEAQQRVGGRLLTSYFDDRTFLDHGGQWVSPGQDEIVALAGQLGVELFPSWSQGRAVEWRDGTRLIAGEGSPADEASTEARAAAQRLAEMAQTVPLDAPWTAPNAAAWDSVSLHAWLEANVSSLGARQTLAAAIEGVFGRATVPTSLLAALFWARSGDPLTPFLATTDPQPERRFVGGAQQLVLRMAAELGDQVTLSAPVLMIRHGPDHVEAQAMGHSAVARRAIVAVPPPMAARIHYDPPLPAMRDHLSQRTAMRWATKVHCLYPNRFWAQADLSGAAASDSGTVRLTADNSPPSGTPGVLMGFIEEVDTLRVGPLSLEERRARVLADLARYFGDSASQPLEYREKNWGEDPYCRGVDGGYWPVGVWTSYGPALAQPIGCLHWASTETAAVWNGKMEGALLAAKRAAGEVATALGCNL